MSFQVNWKLIVVFIKIVFITIVENDKVIATRLIDADYIGANDLGFAQQEQSD